ncbi:MAG: maleylpyruvate isomerase N-terminal domain-containing protein [Acidimicrobiales bacterium]
MDPARHLEIVRTEGERLAAMPADALGAPIPTIDGWDVEKVVRHVGNVHAWVTGALALGPDQTMDDIPRLEPMPKGPACLDGYRDRLDEMVAAFEARDPDEPCLNFAGQGSVGWWMRRQAQEVSVHRVDVQDGVHAAGGPAPDLLAVDGAADGIDEWASFFLAIRFGQRFDRLPATLDGRSIHVHGTDDPAPADGAEWLLRFADGSVEVERTHAKGDVALRGAAPDLLLALWRRRPLESVDVLGDRSVIDTLLDAARF